MKVITEKDFGPLLLNWARKQFEQEIHSDFQRTQQYDGQRAKEHLKVLRQQSPKQLAILARVLPLEVFWETPDAIERRNQLAIEEREAVEKLRADYNTECRGNFMQKVQKRWHAKNDPEIKKQFEEAAEEGKQFHRQVAEQRNLEVATAEPGEWGLIAYKNWGRIVISINLGTGMSMSYRIGLYNFMGEVIRFHDHYLRALGIGSGNWSVENRNMLGEKFLMAVDFAVWHTSQYEEIVNCIFDGPLSASAQ
jgi:hypothetical protein